MLYLETNHKDLYRVQEGAYALRVEPKPAATGETRMGLVLIKKVTCNGCGHVVPATELEEHRRFDCTWKKVEADADTEVLRRPRLLAQLQGFTHFKKSIESASVLYKAQANGLVAVQN